MSYEHVARRRQHLLDMLRDSNRELTTRELYQSCPPEHPPWTHQPERPGWSNVYANLRQLEKRGLISSHKLASGAVLWRSVLSTADRIAFDTLVADLHLDAP